MSNLLKSKFFLGGLIAVALLVGVNVNAQTTTTTTTTVTAPAFTYSGVMKMGMKGPGISTLQAALNSVQSAPQIVVDGSFGPATCAAVKMFQMSKGLTADCVVGPMTGAALTSATVAVITIPTPGLPAGCMSTAGYSSTTGTPCNSSSTLPAGCMSTSGFSTTTGMSCSGGSTPSTPNGPLTGGAGDITVDDSNGFTNEEVEEGDSDVEVLEFTVEADDESDVEVTSVKVEFEETGNVSGVSADFDDYAESVSIWFGGKMVGEADLEDFSESGDIWTKSISLNGAIVRAGDKEDFVVAVTPINNIDSNDSDDDEWTADVTSVRFEDGEGVVTTENNSTVAQEFDFVPAGDGESLELKSSSDDLDAMSLLVDEDDESDEYEVFTFKLETEDNDVDLSELVLQVLTTGGNYNTLVSDVRIEIDGEEADDYEVAGAGSATATLTFDLDEDYTINADDTVEVVVFMTFIKADGDGDGIADGAYDDTGAETVQVRTVSVAGEGADDVSDTATVTGAAHTLSLSAASVTSIDWDVPSTGSIIDFLFTVTADEEDVDIEIADIIANDSTSGTATVGTPTVTRISGDASGTVDDYVVAEGDTARFRVRYAITGANGTFANVTITQVAEQPVPEDDQVSPTATRNVPV